MGWQVEYTDEFGTWWDQLDEKERDSIDVAVAMLEEKGPSLRYPYSSGIKGSRYSNMRELRIQHRGEPYRVLYAFDPRRVALLLVGGGKTGDDRWYESNVPIADRLYEAHLSQIEQEEKR